MGYQIKVSTEDVASKASLVAGQVSQMESDLARLTRDMGALAQSWTGTASGAFQNLYAGWGKQATAIQQELQSIGTSLRSAGVRYADVEQSNTSQMQHM